MAASVFVRKEDSPPRCILCFLIILMFEFNIHYGAVNASSQIIEPVWIQSNPDEWNVNDLFGTTLSSLHVSCNWYLQQFSNASSNFIYCASTCAKPVTFCEKCGDQYKQVLEVVKEIEKDNQCRDKILNSDILQIVKATQQFVITLWKSGHCDNCFNGTVPSEFTYNQYSENTQKFLKLFNDTQDCFKKYNDSSPGMFDGANNSSVICKKCAQQYRNLNRFYDDMGTASTLCMDLVEMMNVTRQQWSKEFSCTQHQKDYKIVVSLAAFFSCLPIIFYMSAMVLARKKVINRANLSFPTSKQDHSVSAFGSNTR